MWRIVSSGLLRRVALVRTDVSEEPDASFIRLTKIGELGTTQAATSNRRTRRSVRRLLVAACVVPSSPIFVTLMKEEPGSYETSVLTRATRRNNPEDTILHSHSSENLKSYMPLINFQNLRNVTTDFSSCKWFIFNAIILLFHSYRMC
jgi:hypothetical protein